MNVVFHVLAAAGIAHIAATRLDPAPDSWFTRADAWVIGPAAFLGVLSHGVLDGLKHGYPLHAVPDILLAGLLATGWSLCVRRRFCLLFAVVVLASLAPDIVDFSPGMLRSVAGRSTPMADFSPLFPWHWSDGSGSMYPVLSRAPDRTRILDVGRNGIVSWTNHLIVIAFAGAGIFANPRVFRFLPAGAAGQAR